MKLSIKNVLGAGSLVVGLCAAYPAFAASTGAQADGEQFQREIERLQAEKASEATRVEAMRQEREQFVREIRRVEALNAKYTREIDSLRGELADKDQVFEQRLKALESKMTQGPSIAPSVLPSSDVASAAPAIPPREVERQATEVLMKGGDLDPEDEKFKEELARAHYNMGNVYFERGEYQRSVVEYYQAVDLMPYDADAHYNLAFASGEYLGDQETALKHYQWYLYLKPNAEDRKLVEEKIVAAKINARGRIDSSIDKTELTGHTNVAR